LLDTIYTVAADDARIAALHALVDEARQLESVVGQPPGDFTYDDFLTAISHAAGGIDTMGGTAYNLGYFDDTRVAGVLSQIEAVCP
ncbi:MAG TPA: hypothetical protein VM285_03115, partial [Polyangia bacterium]|nr:hypothetical protein [Polyangia bacterium]